MADRRSLIFASLLKRHREAARLTQEELAVRAGVGARTVSNLERGVNREPRLSTVRRLSEALELSEYAAEELAASARLPADRQPPDERSGEQRDERTPVAGGFLGATPTARLLARGEELKRTLETLEAAEGGTGRLVLLAGEPGIGKTRLAQEVSVRAQERGFVVASGRCYEAHGGVPFYPFLDALSALYEEASSKVRGAIPERFPYLTMLLPDHFPSWPIAHFYEAGQQSQRLLRAVAGFVREVAAERPVALLLDDLHRADSASVDLLAHLARHIRADRVLLVGTYRDAEVGPEQPLRRAAQELGREQLVEKVDVGRLGREGTAVLVRDRLGGAEAPRGFAGLVHRHTEGNPFFTVEVLKDLIERGDLTRREGLWIHEGFRDLPVPESVGEAISERVSRLRPRTQETLEGASVLGQAFGFEDLTALLGCEDEEVEGALEEAAASGLARTEMDRYAFDHALIQQTLYAGLSPARRKRLHRSAGEALERQRERIRRRRAAEIARHFAEGGAPARSLPHALLAGDEAGGVFAYAEAEHHYRGALELAEEVGDRPGEARALRSLGEALTSAGRYDEALAALERAAKLAAELVDPESEMWAAARIGWVHFRMGRAEEEFVTRLWTLTGQDRPEDDPVPPGVSPRTLNLLRGALAALLFILRDYRGTLEVTRRRSILARELGDEQVVAHAEIARGIALVYLRRPAEAFEVLEAAIPLAEAVDSAGKLEEAMPLAEKSPADGMNMFEYLYTARGELDLSLKWAERGLALAKRLDNPDMIAFRLGRVGLNLFYRGEWKRARLHFERGTKMVSSLGPSFYSARLPGYLSMLCIAEGSWAEAANLLEEAAVMAEQVRWPAVLHSAQISRAQLDLARDRPRAAQAHLEPLAESTDLDWTYATVLLTVLSQAHLELGDATKALEFAERALREAETMDNRLDAVGALRAKGMAQGQQGRRVEAAGTLDEALAMVRPMPYPYEEAKLAREYGVLHIRVGDPEQARERLTAALEIFQRLGASKDAEKTGRTLRELDRA